MRISAILMMTFLVIGDTSAQTSATMSREQILAKMDDNAKKFKSLDASIQRREWDSLTEVESFDSGKIYIQTTKASPRIKLEFTEPKNSAKFVLIDNGKYQLYERHTNTLREAKAKDEEQLQMLLIGFGVTSDKIQKSFNALAPVQETLNGETVSVLELQSKDTRSKVGKVRLWLSQKDWTPDKTELTLAGSRDTWTFTYSDKKLNIPLSSSVFKLDLPPNVKR
jgi:outer membrane lipoprotein-sorting protein